MFPPCQTRPGTSSPRGRPTCARCKAPSPCSAGIRRRICRPRAPRHAGSSSLRALRFERERAVRVPDRLVRELAKLQSESLVAWREARAQSRFERFAPFLARLLTLRREQADALCAPPGGERYDALLEGYEEGRARAPPPPPGRT